MSVDPQLGYKVATDHVGCELVGPDADAFELVGERAAADGRTLRWFGVDGEPGLGGGPMPEEERFRVRLRAQTEPRRYTAAVRIVTQACNLGTVSAGGADLPLEGLWFLTFWSKRRWGIRRSAELAHRRAHGDDG